MKSDGERMIDEAAFLKDAAEKYGITEFQVVSIVTGKTWAKSPGPTHEAMTPRQRGLRCALRRWGYVEATP